MKYYLSILIFISSLNASNLDNELKKEVICDTRESCNKLSLEIQKQIDEIEKKDKLTIEDKKSRYYLKKELISIEKQKQKNESITLIEQNKTIEDNKKIKEKLEIIKESM